MIDILQVLLDKGADVDCKGNDRQSLLHHATRCALKGGASTKMVGFLILKKGANIQSRDNCGWTPLDIGRESNQWQLKQFFNEVACELAHANLLYSI